MSLLYTMKHSAVKSRILQCLVIILNAKHLSASDNNKGNYACVSLKHVYQSENCILIDNNQHLVCLGDYYIYHPIEESADSSELINPYNYESILSLTICDGSESFIDPHALVREFPNLNTLTIINGNLTTITTPFPSEAMIEQIRIIGTQLDYLPEDVFKYLLSLHTVDLRNNALNKIHPEAFNINSLDRVYLAGNPWKCNYNMSWILNMENNSLAEKIEDREKLHCTVPYEGRPLVAVVEIIVTLKGECDRTVCDCELIYAVVRRNSRRQINRRQLMAFVAVNCSHRGLEQMPEFIPANTTRLYLVGNKISQLTPIITNQIYKEVRDLYLDHNLIESITQLEGSYWLEHFRVFSLRGNKLTELPTYALDNVLHQSGNAVSIYLGNNPWTCDCLFTPGFQDLLIRHTNLIKDVHDIKCHTLTNNIGGNSGKVIRDLTRTEICITPGDDVFLLYPLDMLNIILAALIILIIGKLLYDYWLFKRTGKLPWIVTKIP